MRLRCILLSLQEPQTPFENKSTSWRTYFCQIPFSLVWKSTWREISDFQIELRTVFWNDSYCLENMFREPGRVSKRLINRNLSVKFNLTSINEKMLTNYSNFIFLFELTVQGKIFCSDFLFCFLNIRKKSPESWY